MLSYKDKLVLFQMQEFIEEIESFQKRFGNQYEDFISDIAYKNALSMSAMQLGEIKKSLSDEFLSAYATYFKWDALRKLRNEFAHAYAMLDNQVIWDFAKEDMPELKAAIEKILFEDTKL